jgi:hypothetical protein
VVCQQYHGLQAKVRVRYRLRFSGNLIKFQGLAFLPETPSSPLCRYATSSRALEFRLMIGTHFFGRLDYLRFQLGRQVFIVTELLGV